MLSYSQIITCCGLSDVEPKVLIYATCIKKVISKDYSFSLRSKITDLQYRSVTSLAHQMGRSVF